MLVHVSDRPGVTIVGAGAVGSALGVHLAGAGYPVLAVLSRTRRRAERLARRLGATASNRWTDLPADTRLLFCCVADDAVPAVAEALAAVPHAWAETTAAHTSGLLTAAALAPLARAGAHAMSFHPLQTFPGDGPPPSFRGIFVALEGDAEAVALGRRVTLDLGARYLELPAEAKAAYHLAASTASNFLVTLMALVQEILHAVGIDEATGLALVQPLVEQSWRNVLHRSPEEALTGPIARGDVETVARHNAVLAEHLPHLAPVYAALAAETVRVAVRSGRLDPARAGEILDRLHHLVAPAA